MPVTNPSVQPLAWTFQPEALPQELRYVYALRMPSAVLRALKGLRKPDAAQVAPISSLHDMLAAASHNIVAFAPNILQAPQGSPRWLYIRADHQLDVNHLETLLSAWLNVNYPDQAAGILPEWRKVDWVWDYIDLVVQPDLQPLLLPG